MSYDSLSILQGDAQASDNKKIVEGSEQQKIICGACPKINGKFDRVAEFMSWRNVLNRILSLSSRL